ncbi:MAG TPA: hypothetical protein VIW24_30030 [Aldersonia sp.]
MSASNESLTYRSALGTAGAGVGQLAKGTSGLSLLALRSAVQLGEAGLARSRASRAARRLEAPERRSRVHVLIAVAAGVVALAAGAAAFRWLRQRPEPEVAAEPPTLRPSTNGHAPSTNGSAPVSTTAESDRTN